MNKRQHEEEADRNERGEDGLPKKPKIEKGAPESVTEAIAKQEMTTPEEQEQKQIVLDKKQQHREGFFEIFKKAHARLDLPWTNVSDDDAIYLSKIIANYEPDALTFLDLTGNYVDFEGANQLFKVLQKQTKLNTVKISWNRLQHKACESLRELLASDHPLSHLAINGNNISNQGIAEIAGGLLTNKNLTYLDKCYSRTTHCNLSIYPIIR